VVRALLAGKTVEWDFESRTSGINSFYGHIPCDIGIAVTVEMTIARNAYGSQLVARDARILDARVREMGMLNQLGVGRAAGLPSGRQAVPPGR